MKYDLENNRICVIIPLDPTEGDKYIETVHGNEELDNLYRVSTQGGEQTNPMTRGTTAINQDNEDPSNLEKELEHW